MRSNSLMFKKKKKKKLCAPWLAGAREIEVTFLFFKYWKYLVLGFSCWFCSPVICWNIKGKKKGILKSSCFVTALSLTSGNGYLLSTECKSISRLKPNSLIYILLTALSFPVKQEEKVIRYEAAVLLMEGWSKMWGTLLFSAYTSEQLVLVDKDNCRVPRFVHYLRGFCFFSFIKSHVFIFKY